MGHKNIIISGTAIYHPENKLNNDFFIEHFKKLGIEITGLLKHLDRSERYIIKNNEENVISMSVMASKKVLNETNLSPESIDMLVFVSDTPQYTSPTNAMLIHNELGLKKANVIFDLNDNCIGMITAIDFVSNYMQSNSGIKNALIVGSQMVSCFAREDDPITYATSGDGAAAVILQSRIEDKRRGVLGSNYYTDSSLSDKMRFPACGMCKIFDENIDKNAKKMIFIPHDVSFFSDAWTKLITNMLNKNHLKPQNIEHYFFSQFSHADIYETLNKLNVDYSKHTFVANRYGYTGCTSPIFAFNDAFSRKKLHEDDYVVFCSVGIGFTMSAILYKF